MKGVGAFIDGKPIRLYGKEVDFIPLDEKPASTVTEAKGKKKLAHSPGDRAHGGEERSQDQPPLSTPPRTDLSASQSQEK